MTKNVVLSALLKVRVAQSVVLSAVLKVKVAKSVVLSALLKVRVAKSLVLSSVFKVKVAKSVVLSEMVSNFGPPKKGFPRHGPKLTTDTIKLTIEIDTFRSPEFFQEIRPRKPWRP